MASPCDVAQADIQGEDCNRIIRAARGVSPASGAMSVPPEMFRGATALVRLTIRAGSDQQAANDDAAIDGYKTVRIPAARHGRYMEAQLTGEGFKIVARSPMRVDAFTTGVTTWEWEIEPLRALRHNLRANAWILYRRADGTMVRAERVTVPSKTVTVPVRWWPDRVDDFLDDSQTAMSRFEVWLGGLAALLAALLAVWVALRKFGKAGDKAKPA